jgi:hypothetical protein
MVKGVATDELAATYPRLFHITSEGSWRFIEKHGLLSTEALLDLFEIVGAERHRILRSRRPECITISHPEHGRAIIRDQKPLIESRLRAVLEDGLSAEDWYALLNRKTFFWVSSDRVETLRNARAYQDLRQTLLEVDTAKLLERHSATVHLCPMNSGATRPMAFPRGKRTFLPLAEYPFNERRRKRGRKHAVVELTVEYAVEDIRDLTIRASEIGGGRPDSELYRR